MSYSNWIYELRGNNSMTISPENHSRIMQVYDDYVGMIDDCHGEGNTYGADNLSAQLIDFLHDEVDAGTMRLNRTRSSNLVRELLYDRRGFYLV